MDQHVTYHPITDELLQSYRYYISGDDGARVAAEHCGAMGMDEALTTRFLDLLPHFAKPDAYPFDQTHGFSIALTQGFFGPYFYINGGQLSGLGDVIAPYVRPWQQSLPDWDMAATAQNTVLSQFSSGVFISADQVASFMSDAHTVPELSQALATHFPGNALGVLWSALQYAHDAGSGLLEAAGALEPNLADPTLSTCYTRLDHCDPSSLQVYAAGQQTAPPVSPEPELPVPPHLADRVSVNAGERLPSTPSLTERLRAKRGDAPMPDTTAEEQ